MKQRLWGQAAVALTCLIGCGAYAGAIRLPSLFAYLLPAVLVVGVVALSQRRLLTGMVAVAVSSLVLSEAVNVLTGLTSGPVARSTAVASAATGGAVLLAKTRRPAAFLPAVLVVLVGALALGAGGKVPVVAVACAGAALLSLALLERDRRRPLVVERRVVPLAFAVALMVAAGIGTALLQVKHDARPALSPLASTLTTTVDAPDVLGLSKPPPTAKPEARRTTAPARAMSPSSASTKATSGGGTAGRRVRPTNGTHTSWLWWLWLLPLILLPIALRLAVAEWLWRRKWRRIRRGDAHPAVAAWKWYASHLHRLGWGLPPSASPDSVIADSVLGNLASAASEQAFAHASPVPQGPDPWRLARQLATEAWRQAKRAHRWRARWRFP